MMNIIRADAYRIFRSKAIYITALLLVGLTILISITSGGVGVASGVMDGLYAPDDTSAPGGGLAILAEALRDTDMLIYFFIPIFMLVSTDMFSCGAIKNDLAAGISRVKLYMAKLMLSILLCLLLTLLFAVAALLCGILMNGFGGAVTGSYLAGLLKILGAQCAVLVSFVSIGVFLSFVTRRAAAVNGVYIAFCLVPILVISIISEYNEKALALLKYDLIGCVKTFAFINTLPAADILRALLVSAVYLLISTFGGIALFKRAEIK